MPSNAAKGQYYKAKTKRWLEAHGFAVAFMERMMFIHTAHGRVPVKRDQFGSDLLAMSRQAIVFVQVKGGKYGSKQINAGLKAFDAFEFPPMSQQCVIAWKPRARQPEIVYRSSRDAAA